jgi:hypothetical protein
MNEVTFIDKTGERLLRALRSEGAQFISGGCYVRHIVERLKVRRKRKISNLLASFLVGFVLVLFDTTAIRAQSTTVLGSVPSGPATDQVVQLTLRDAVNTALHARWPPSPHERGFFAAADPAKIALLHHCCGSVPVHHTHLSLPSKMQSSESSGDNQRL